VAVGAGAGAARGGPPRQPPPVARPIRAGARAPTRTVGHGEWCTSPSGPPTGVGTSDAPASRHTSSGGGRVDGGGGGGVAGNKGAHGEAATAPRGARGGAATHCHDAVDADDSDDGGGNVAAGSAAAARQPALVAASRDSVPAGGGGTHGSASSRRGASGSGDAAVANVRVLAASSPPPPPTDVDADAVAEPPARCAPDDTPPSLSPSTGGPSTPPSPTRGRLAPRRWRLCTDRAARNRVGSGVAGTSQHPRQRHSERSVWAAAPAPPPYLEEDDSGGDGGGAVSGRWPFNGVRRRWRGGSGGPVRHPLSPTVGVVLAIRRRRRGRWPSPSTEAVAADSA